MVEMSTGDYLWILNDDVIVMTQDYDLMIKSEIESFLRGRSPREQYSLQNKYEDYSGKLHEAGACPDRIAYCTTNEIYAKVGRERAATYNASINKLDWVASYPIVTRELVDSMGCMMPLEISGDGADIALAKIVKSLLVSRSLKMPKITIIDQVYAETTEAYGYKEEEESESDHRCHNNTWLLNVDREAEYIEMLHQRIKDNAETGEDGGFHIDVPVPYDARFTLLFKCSRCGEIVPVDVDMIRYSMEHLQCNSCKHMMLISKMMPTQGFLWYMNCVQQAIRACYPALTVELFVPLLQRILMQAGIGKLFAEFIARNAEEIESGLGDYDEADQMKLKKILEGEGKE